MIDNNILDHIFSYDNTYHLLYDKIILDFKKKCRLSIPSNIIKRKNYVLNKYLSYTVPFLVNKIFSKIYLNYIFSECNKIKEENPYDNTKICFDYILNTNIENKIKYIQSYAKSKKLDLIIFSLKEYDVFLLILKFIREKYKLNNIQAIKIRKILYEFFMFIDCNFDYKERVIITYILSHNENLINNLLELI